MGIAQIGEHQPLLNNTGSTDHTTEPNDNLQTPFMSSTSSLARRDPSVPAEVGLDASAPRAPSFLTPQKSVMGLTRPIEHLNSVSPAVDELVSLSEVAFSTVRRYVQSVRGDIAGARGEVAILFH